MRTPIESMRLVAQRMRSLQTSFVFVGGAVVPILVDHPSLTEFRPTKDVDLVTEVVTLGEFYALEEKLRRAGFRHDTSEEAPLCRWVIEGCRVDIMPVDAYRDELAMVPRSPRRFSPRRSRGGP